MQERVCCNAEGSVDLVAGLVTDQDDGDRRVFVASLTGYGRMVTDVDVAPEVGSGGVFGDVDRIREISDLSERPKGFGRSSMRDPVWKDGVDVWSMEVDGRPFASMSSSYAVA